MISSAHAGLDQREPYPLTPSYDPPGSSVRDSSTTRAAGPTHPWRVLVVHPTREFAVASKLRDYEAYVPSTLEQRQWSDRRKVIDRPLMSGYVFSRFGVADRSRVYGRSPYIVGGLEFAHVLATVTDQEIAWLRMLTTSGVPIAAGEILHCGDRVRVTVGRLAGIEGRLLEIGRETRLVVEFAILGRAVHATVTRDQVRKV